MVVRDAVSTFQCSKTSEHPVSFNETLRDICKGRVLKLTLYMRKENNGLSVVVVVVFVHSSNHCGRKLWHVYGHLTLLFRSAATTKKLNDKFQKSHGRRSWLSKFRPGRIRIFIREIILNFFFFLSISLEELGSERDNVVSAFKQLSEEYENKFRKQFWCGHLN